MNPRSAELLQEFLVAPQKNGHSRERSQRITERMIESEKDHLISKLLIIFNPDSRTHQSRREEGPQSLRREKPERRKQTAKPKPQITIETKNNKII